KFAGEQVPAFEEILDTYRGQIGMLIELKSPELYPGNEEKVADALIERKIHRPNINKIIIQSFNNEAVQTSKQLLLKIPHGVLAGMIAADVTDEQLVKCATYSNYFNSNRNIVDHELVEGVHRSGLKIYAYPIRAQEQADKLFATGVDGIITDFPEYVNDFSGQK